MWVLDTGRVEENRSMPDLIDYEKVLAISLMQNPIRFVDTKGERAEDGIMHGLRCLGQCTVLR